MDGRKNTRLEGAAILERHPEIMFARAIRLENAIQRRPIPGLVPRGRAQRFVDRGIPVCAEAALSPGRSFAGAEDPSSRNSSIAPSSRDVEIDRERCGNPLYFPAPVVEEVGIFHEHARQGARVSLGQQIVFQP